MCLGSGSVWDLFRVQLAFHFVGFFFHGLNKNLLSSWVSCQILVLRFRGRGPSVLETALVSHSAA